MWSELVSISHMLGIISDMYIKSSVTILMGFPSGSVVKHLPANAKDVGFIPGLGRSSGEGNDNPLQYSCLGNPMDRGTWWAICSPWGGKRVGQNLLHETTAMVMVVTLPKPDALSGFIIKVQHLEFRKVMAHTLSLFQPDSRERSSCIIPAGGDSSSLECLTKRAAAVREAKEISVRNWGCLVQRRETLVELIVLSANIHHLNEWLKRVRATIC